jgi:A/G-specific adenine glycosylase
MMAEVSPKILRAFRRDLVRWYGRHRRDLPWRGTRDPYRVWVSEIMLQQTRVEVVREYYRRWLRAFPTLESLARARESRVLKLWEGLGYYARARNLHRAAKLVRGRVPATVEGLRKLPGIGRYTAGAIASIAFGIRAPVVDGNVARVFARVFGREAQWWAIAEELLPASGGRASRRAAARQEPRPPNQMGDFNQALMELGALVCLPANPKCDVCPLRRVCVARERGWQDRLPKRVRRRSRHVTHDVVLARQDGKVLLRQRPKTGLLAGLWELPAGKSGRPVLTIRHTITDRQITLRVFAGEATGGRWFTRRQAERLTMPAAHRRALTQLLSPQ